MTIRRDRRGRKSAAAAVALTAIFCGGFVLAAAGDAGGGTVRARYLMGTRLSIETEGAGKVEAIEDAFDEVARLESVLSNWSERSEISLLNRRAARAPVPCSPDLFAAIDVALRWAETTGGAFDPTVEPLVVAFGLRAEMDRLPYGEAFGREPGGQPRLPAAPAGAPPPDGAPVGWRHVHLDPGARTVRFDAPGAGLDFGGIGKGIALDAAARVLRRHGVERALLDFGGQVLAVGHPAASGGWMIDIADPADRERPTGSLEIADTSVATSGNSERSAAGTGGPIGHLLDPATRRPALFTGSLTVASADATSADALSTALFVMGPEKGTAWADARGIAAVYVWREATGSGIWKASRAFRERFATWAPGIR